jgi:hypothetical protein
MNGTGKASKKAERRRDPKGLYVFLVKRSCPCRMIWTVAVSPLAIKSLSSPSNACAFYSHVHVLCIWRQSFLLLGCMLVDLLCIFDIDDSLEPLLANLC